MDRSMFASVKRKYAEVEWFFKLYVLLLSLFFYPITIVIVTVFLRLGGLSWAVIVGFLAPPTVAWYIIVKRRVESYLKWLISSKPREWNIEKSIREYIELLKKHERSKGS